MSVIDPAVIESQAAAWLVRLDSRQASAAERVEFENWLQANPRHRVAFLRLQVAWRRVDKLTALGAFDEQTGKGRAWVSVAVAAVLFLAVGVAAWTIFGVSGSRTYVTEVGNSGRFVLQDGSTMILNTDTKVRVKVADRYRRIALVRGEAYFQVAPDSRRPFEVSAGATRVRALGTAFSVRLRAPENVEVVVSQGKVAVRRPRGRSDEVTALTANESAVVTAAGLQRQTLAAVDIPRKLAWQGGLLRFNGETLADAVAEFNRYNKRQLVIADPSIADLRMGGGFQTTDLESFVKALENSFGVRAESGGGNHVIALRPKSE